LELNYQFFIFYHKLVELDKKFNDNDI
jgi:hypothetical protein